MKRIAAPIAALACLATAWSAGARAASIVVADHGDHAVVRVVGKFRPNDGIAVVKALDGWRGAPITTIELASPGGNLYAGLDIGFAVRMRHLDTAVRAHTTCASACAFAWLGGWNRRASPTARLLFHGAYDVETLKPSILGNVVVGGYMTSLGLGPDVVVWATEPDVSQPMRRLTPDAASVMGIGMIVEPDDPDDGADDLTAASRRIGFAPSDRQPTRSAAQSALCYADVETALGTVRRPGGTAPYADRDAFVDDMADRLRSCVMDDLASRDLSRAQRAASRRILMRLYDGKAAESRIGAWIRAMAEAKMTALTRSATLPSEATDQTVAQDAATTSTVGVSGKP